MDEIQFIENEIKLREALLKQNQFILDFFNDNRIPKDVKDEWSAKYNDMKIYKILEK